MINHNIPKEKAELHLKLGRQLAVFIKTDTYFESATFDWISLQKQTELYKTTLIRTIHQGDEIFNDVLSFDTVNQFADGYDELTNHFFVGSLNDCLSWIETNYTATELTFIRTESLNEIYADLVAKGVFDDN